MATSFSLTEAATCTGGENRPALQTLVDLLLKGRQLLSDDYKS